MALTYGIRHNDGGLKGVAISNRAGGSALITETSGFGLHPIYDIDIYLTDEHGWVINTSDVGGGVQAFGVVIGDAGRHGVYIIGSRASIHGLRVADPSQETGSTWDHINVEGDNNEIIGYRLGGNAILPERSGLRFESGADNNRYLGSAGSGVATALNDLGTGNIDLAGGVGTHDHSAGEGGTLSHDDLTDQTPEHDLYAAFSQTGDVTTTTGAHRFYVRHSFDIIDVEATVGTAPSGGSVVVDANINGTSVYSTGHPTIATGTNTSGAAAPDGTSTGTSGQYITIDVDSTTAPAADLTVIVRYRRT